MQSTLDAISYSYTMTLDTDRLFRSQVFDVVEHQKFDMFIAFFIVTNVVSMAFDTFKPAKWQQVSNPAT
jgi:hypothetical protein